MAYLYHLVLLAIRMNELQHIQPTGMNFPDIILSKIQKNTCGSFIYMKFKTGQNQSLIVFFFLLSIKL